jgi:GTP-binding protein HflX
LELIETAKAQRKERVLLVGVCFSQDGEWDVEDHLDELRRLAETAKADVVDQLIVRRRGPSVSHYIGKGKVEEIGELMVKRDVDTLIFDDDLTAAQQRNIEERIQHKVIDRTELILDIFAQRAKTREAKIQIELAQLKYLLSRLTRMWTHLSKQYGGIGTKGPGETQLEVDRRKLRERIHTLGREVRDVRKSRATQRKSRRRNNFHTAVLVGYTNAGKSTLINALSGANVAASRKLFSTLDPTTRRIPLPGKHKLLVSDTVGFIRKLPHHLVESFMATLEEVVEADILIHVLDVSDEHFEERAEAVYNVLEEIGYHDKPIITALNKVDRLEGSLTIERYDAKYPHCVAISAKNGEGFDELFREIDSVFDEEFSTHILSIPQKDSRSVSALYREGNIIRKAYVDNRVILEAELSARLVARFQRYIHSPNEEEMGLLHSN